MGPPLGELVRHLAEDVKALTRDELILAKLELQRTAKQAAIDTAVALLGAIVALIGLALLCTAVVALLDPIIPPLWLRLVIMAVVYVVIGGAVAGSYAKKLRRDAVPDFSEAANEARHTVHDVKACLRGPGAPDGSVARRS